MPRSPLFLAAACVAVLAGSAVLAARPAAQAPPSLAPYLPTPQEVVDRMLQMAAVTKADVVYDLGSGDGRLVITAAKRYGARGVGIDIDPALIAQSRASARKEGVEGLVEFRQQDALTVDLSPASVVTLYLLTRLNEKLKPKLLKDLKPGTRVVSHAFDMGDWKPEETASVGASSVYLWRIPTGGKA